MDTMEHHSYPKVCRKYARKWYNRGMSFGIPNPVKPEHDIAIWCSLGLAAVEGISAKGRDAMNDQTTLLTDADLVLLLEFCKLYELQVVFNPELTGQDKLEDMELRQVVQEVLNEGGF